MKATEITINGQIHHLFIGYEYQNTSRGRIYLNNVHFANFYTNKDTQKIIFNRDSYALNLNFPSVFPPFNDTYDMLEWIKNTLESTEPSKP